MTETKEQKEKRLMNIIEHGFTVSSENSDWLWNNSAEYHDLITWDIKKTSKKRCTHCKDGILTVKPEMLTKDFEISGPADIRCLFCEGEGIV